jgi:acyl-CoA synthetase (AMP-forming)/AMP-acid ligase II/NADP-dependent 3-hydroxy acid dehydrogenase YdfG
MTPSTGEPAELGDAELQALDACILDHPAVRDCALIRRTDRRGESTLIAYVVTRDELSLDSLCGHARTAGCTLLPSALVRISNVPLREDGAVDEAALVSLPVIEPETVERCDALVRATGSVSDVEVVSEWHAPPGLNLRVDDLVPNRSEARTLGRSSAQSDAAPPRDVPPAVSIGEPIRFVDRPPDDLPCMLARAADLQPTHGVTFVEQDGEQTIPYPELRDQAERIMAGLRAAGVRPGDPVVFQLDRNVDFIEAFWGCLLGGFVPVPIPVSTVPDPEGPAATKLKNVWQSLGRPLVITSAEMETALTFLGPRPRSSDVTCVTVDRLREAPAGAPWHRCEPADLALLLLTSGSTGLPKAVTQTHGALIAACASMAQRTGFSVRDVPLNWVSLDHGGGIIMCHLVFVALASQQVHVRTEFVLQDVLRWLDLIERHRATFTWAPNFAFALVNGRADDIAARRWDLSSMGFVLNGGEAVVTQTARRFLRLLAPHGLPPTAMRPAWGMAETCSASTFASPLALDPAGEGDRLVEVGPPDPGFEIRIVDEGGNVLSEDMEGRLEVHGSVVTRGYLNNPEANAESFTADGWFRTGDLGRVHQGRLTITGREKGVIIINGVNYYAHEIEAAVEGVPGVTPSFAAAFSARQPGADTDALVVAFHTPQTSDDDIATLSRSIRSVVMDRVGVVPAYLLPVNQGDIPKTSIGKIQRPALAKRFAQGGFAGVIKRVQQLTGQEEAVPDWFFRPVWRKRPPVAHRPLGRGCTVVIVAGEDAVADALERAVGERGARPLRVAAGGTPRLNSGETSGPQPSVEFQRILAGIPVEERLVVAYGAASARRPRGGPDEWATSLATTEGVVALVQALAQSTRAAGACDLLVYDDGSQHVLPGDRTACGKTTALPLLRTASQEHTGIVVRHVDLPRDAPGVVARTLLNELADRREEPEVAYRDGDRWVRRLEKRPPFASPRGHELGRTDGFYLVTGGLGGLGAEVCRHLLRASEAPLLLVGRRPITDDADERRTLIGSLDGLGVVHFEALDINDYDALRLAVEAAAKRWGRPLAGVLHLAGVFEPRALMAETGETLVGAIEAKVRGGWNIHRLLLHHPNAVLVAFSSVNGYFGGYASGAYAAANAFLDGLVRHQVLELGRTAYSLAWSLWDGVGMSRKYVLKDAAKRVGYSAVPVRQGIMSLEAAIGSEPGHVLIGLDGGNPHVGRDVAGGLVSSGLTLNWVKANGVPALASPPMEDRFGVAVPCRVREVPHLGRRGGPDTGTGQVDGGRGQTLGSDLERAIAEVWRDVLPSGEIGREQNFFDAGASSLLVATASRKLGQVLGRDVPMTDIYRFPTVRLLAAEYAGTDNADAVGLEESETRGQARRARRLQQRQRNV